MNSPTFSTQPTVLRVYYVATALFIVLDYFFGINVRLAFFEQAANWRAAYYIVLLTCLGLMVWRPNWTTWIATIESLITLSFLIIFMGARVFNMSDHLMRGGSIVTLQEIINFLISGGVAYFAYVRGIRKLGLDKSGLW